MQPESTNKSGSLQFKFKTSKPIKRTTTADAVGTSCDIIKGVPVTKLVDGKHYFRILPQPEHSTLAWSVTVEIINAFGVDGFRGKIWLHEGIVELFRKTKKFLWQHHQDIIKTKDNPRGIDFGTSFKTVMLATEPDNRAELWALILPATIPYPMKDGTARREGCGTKIERLCEEIGRDGQPKYGDITDLETGRIICVEVTNGGTMQATYNAYAEEPYNILKAEYLEVLDRVPALNECMVQMPVEEFAKFLLAKIPANIREEVDSYLNLSEIANGGRKATSETRLTASEAERQFSNVPAPANVPAPTTPKVDDATQARLDALRSKVAAGRKPVDTDNIPY